MYRNHYDIVSLDGDNVEAGSLWELQSDNLLVLVDDDLYASYYLDNKLFYKI